jgi:AAHS family 4-hydroxybenzoate transporter-like MFS transporter
MFPVSAHIYPTALRASGVGWALGIARAWGVASAFAGSAVLAFGTGPGPFFLFVAVVIGVVLIGVLLLRRHVPPREAAANTR